MTNEHQEVFKDPRKVLVLTNIIVNGLFGHFGGKFAGSVGKNLGPAWRTAGGSAVQVVTGTVGGKTAESVENLIEGSNKK